MAKAGFKPLIIAVDGPAASGKGSLARILAEYYGYTHLDTGKLYRAVGAKLLKSGNVPSVLDEKIKHKAASVAATLSVEDIRAGGLENEVVGRAASIVSAIGEVRAALLAFQRKIANSKGGAVLDGRDIGTVVCPNADIKLFITASLEARAGRRYKQLQSDDNSVTYATVLQDLADRDRRDEGRSIAPMKPAVDAIQLDTTELTLDDVFKRLEPVISTSAIE